MDQIDLTVNLSNPVLSRLVSAVIMMLSRTVGDQVYVKLFGFPWNF